MATIISILTFILVLGLLVFVHELGHFLFAKLANVKVEEFAFGFGPRIWAKKVGETEYRINIFPIGGYVKMLGEMEDSKEERSYSQQPIRDRVLIITGGVLMNFLLAGIIYTIYLIINSFSLVFPVLAEYNFAFAEQTDAVVVSYIEEGSPAEETGIKPGAIIREIDGNEFSDSAELVEYVNQHRGENLQFTYKNYYDSTESSDSVVPRVETEGDQGAIGIGLIRATEVEYEGINRIFSGFEHTINMLGYTLVVFKDLILSAVQSGDISYVSNNVSGPVGIYVATDAVLRSGGVVGLLDITALMSASLALMNILPFPALDGGHLILTILEKIRGKKLNEKIEYWLTFSGFAVLMLLMLVISAKDLFQFGVIDALIFWN